MSGSCEVYHRQSVPQSDCLLEIKEVNMITGGWGQQAFELGASAIGSQAMDHGSKRQQNNDS